jgi:hypothetical protein
MYNSQTNAPSAKQLPVRALPTDLREAGSERNITAP